MSFLPKEVVNAVQRGMPKRPRRPAPSRGRDLRPQALGERGPKRGGSLESGGAAGKRPKIGEGEGKPLRKDPEEERPFAGPSDRRGYPQTVAGVGVSRPKVCRSLRRMEQTCKNGDEAPWSERSL